MTQIEAPRIFASRRYRDARTMIAWLEEAFGFQRHYIVDDENGGVAHSQVAFGSSMIMLGDIRDDDSCKGGGTVDDGQALYIAVDDADAMHDRAKKAGAKIERELEDQFYGSRDFSCRDPEGYLWNFGTYWPKAHEAPED